MTHAEIWDDSALVDSWNEALEEYKHYHSLHARGEKVMDVLETHGKDLNSNDTNRTPGKNAAPDERPEDGMIMDDSKEIKVGNEVERASTQQGHETDDKVSLDEQDVLGMRANDGPSSAPPSLPQHLIGAVRDEGMKNLLMSWYYAGYYTGLHEGQQIATTNDLGKGDKSG